MYGLGADAANPAALRRLFAVKGRPADHPVIVHVARAAQLDDLGRDVPDVAHALARAFWPGPLTLVVRRNPDRVAAEATGGRDTVGIRVPDHPVALALLDAFGGGVAAPSANRFGRVSPTTAQHVRDDLGADVDVVLDGGPCDRRRRVDDRRRHRRRTGRVARRRHRRGPARGDRRRAARAPHER